MKLVLDSGTVTTATILFVVVTVLSFFILKTSKPSFLNNKYNNFDNLKALIYSVVVAVIYTVISAIFSMYIDAISKKYNDTIH